LPLTNGEQLTIARRVRWDKYKSDVEANGKLCFSCNRQLPLSEFGKRPKRFLGIATWCKDCTNLKWSRAAATRGIREASRQLRGKQKRKDEVYNAYGGYICRCCGETDPIFLTIDHVNNDGYVHRKQFKTDIYSWLRTNGYPSGFQVLCWNCNRAKHYNNGICPHRVGLIELANLVSRYVT
jgi:hypothetical protein